MGACGKNHNHRLEHTQAQEHKLPVTNTSSTYNYNHTQRHFISHFPCYFLFDHWHRRTQMHMHMDSSGSFFPYRTGAWTNQSSLSRGDALSSRGVHMKEQQNIKECPRIHCSAQCEDNLALMENLDQRPGLHNCTFPNKHCAIWRVGQTSGLLRPAPVHRHRQHHSFHLAMFSISMSR